MTFVILLIFFGIFCFLNRFTFDSLFSTVFIGRLALLVVILISSSFYIHTALKITESTPGATEMTRNILYFFGLFQALIAIGLLFVKSLKWTSIVLIASLAILILLNSFDIFTEFNFLGEKNANKQILSKAFGYLALIVWAYLFCIHFKSGEGIVGWKKSV